MALTDENPHILAVTIESDPQPGTPSGYRAVVETDLDPGTPDDTEREKITEMLGLIELRLRRENPALTRVILHQRPGSDAAATG